MSHTLTLVGRTVLIMHGDTFQTAYLGEVLRRSGAVIGGVVHSAAEGVRLLNEINLPVGVVVSSTIVGYDKERLSDVVSARAAVALTVHPARDTATASSDRQCALVAPYAGFQVVDALAELFTTVSRISNAPINAGGPGR